MELRRTGGGGGSLDRGVAEVEPLRTFTWDGVVEEIEVLLTGFGGGTRLVGTGETGPALLVEEIEQLLIGLGGGTKLRETAETGPALLEDFRNGGGGGGGINPV